MKYFVEARTRETLLFREWRNCKKRWMVFRRSPRKDPKRYTFFISVINGTGWPRRRENREFGCYFFPDRENTGNFVLTQGKIC